MTEVNQLQLEDYDDEDIIDVIIELEKSFKVKFSKTAFLNVKTFGDLCDVIQSYINYEHADGCTKQQAFYKIRRAINTVLAVKEGSIKPDSQLAELFPRKNRRQQVRAFEKHLGIKTAILTYPDWLVLVFLAGLLSSFICFFFYWQIAICGVMLSLLAFNIAGKLAKGLNVQTVRLLTEKIATTRYLDVRRTSGTINRHEILDTIKTAFSSHLGIDKKHLTENTSFSWA